MTFYTPHKRVSLDFTNTTSMTKQSFKSECDINNIIKQFSKTGIINHINPKSAQYIDLPDIIDYQSSLHQIMQAENAFSSLSSKVRDHYSNDPALFLQALDDPSQREYLTSVGVFNAPTPPSSPPASPHPPVEAPPAAAK